MPAKPRIAVTGSTGLIGSAVVEALSRQPCQIVRLIRPSTRVASKGENLLVWDPENGRVETSRLQGLRALIHLGGESIAQRWTPEAKKRIFNSRVGTTRTLVKTLLNLDHPPDVVLAASATGYYGGLPDSPLTEVSPRGSGFLSDVCFEWEQALAPLARKGTRVVNLRFGMVLSPKGGALARLLPVFRLGLGGPLGGGRQMMSWIALDEIPHMIHHLLERPDCSGPFNLVAPQSVTNAEFTKMLAALLKRPACLPVPRAVIKALLGEMGEALLLSSLNAAPERLLKSGYSFRFPELDGALRSALK